MFEDLSWCQIVTATGLLVAIVLAALILDKVNKKGNNSKLRRVKDYAQYACVNQPQVDKDDFTPKDCARECNENGPNECCDLVCQRGDDGVYFGCQPNTNRHCNLPYPQPQS